MARSLRITKQTPLWLAIIIVVITLVQQYDLIKPAQKQLVQNQPGLYHVLQVFDGDTIEVDMNGTKEKIRLIGVDTPETHDPRKNVQCYGKAASNFSKQHLANQAVRLEADPINSNRDRYDRLLRYVYLNDGRLWNAELIKQGYGFAYVSFPFTKSDEFLQYQREAREANRGLWGNCELTPNDRGGFTPNDDTNL